MMHFFQSVCGAALAAAFLPAAALADEVGDAIVVTATRAPGGIERDLFGGSVTILDADALDDRQIRILSDILRDVPGVAVSRSGGVGGLTQLRLRGTESNHTLVLIDGIEASDPFRGEFDFSSLIADDVARVEVLRGQQSALYGSDAIGGVVHYITADGVEAPGLRGRIEGGSLGTVSGAARAAGVSAGLDYALSGAFNVTDGTPTARNGTRNLGAATQSLSAKLRYAAAPNIRLKAVGRYTRTRAEFNNQDFDFTSPTYGLVIDTDDEYVNRALQGLIGVEADFLEGRWTHAITAQANDTDRKEWNDGGPTFVTNGGRLKGSYDTSFHFGTGAAHHVLTAAMDLERERYRNAPIGEAGPGNAWHHIDTVGIVAGYDADIGGRIGLGASVRHDRNDRFLDATTYRLRASGRVTGGLYLRAAAGTGVKNPTIFELYGYDPGTFIGNDALRPEKSSGWEIGSDLVLQDGAVRVAATYFDSKLKDEIYTIYTPRFESSPANRDTDSTQRGVELSASARIGRPTRIDLAYTWTDAKENGVRELRRPEHIASANVAWRGLADRLSVTATLRYNGVAYDTDFRDFSTTRLHAYLLGNIAAEYRLNPGLGLFGRIENLFDTDYEDVFSYRTPGRAAYAGIRAGF